MKLCYGPDPAHEPDQLVKTKAPQAIRSMFDAISPTYDFLNHFLSANTDRRWRRYLARRVLAPSHTRILDVCCGTGDVLLALAQRAAQLGLSPMLVGTDFSYPMLQRAAAKGRTKAQPYRTAAFHWARADTIQLPFPDETFDLVTVAFGIRNVSNFYTGLKELWRVTRQGGQLAVLEFSQPKGVLLRRFYGWYFHRVLPAVGRLISGSNAYVYLPKSVSEFPEGQAFCAALGKAGWNEPSAEPLTWGIATLYVAQK